jgi:putative endonuclease
MQDYSVYILASSYNGTLYVGMTNNLAKRVWQHKSGFAEGFTKKYKVHMLVYYEVAHDVGAAIKREKQIKAWRRQWKLNAINQFIPGWKDLYSYIL